jgi:peptidoglycan biosynthesis protein MviN/MurJ (putative lipid II flippase)
VLGAILGPTFFANGAQSGLLLPSLVYTIIAGPLVAMVVIPTLVRVISDRTTARAAEVLGRISGFMLLVAAGLTVGLVGLSFLVARALTFGVPDRLSDRAHALAVLLVLVVSPQIVLYVIAAIGVAAQQARSRFALAAAAPAVENIGVIVTVVVAGRVFDTGLEVDTVPIGFVLVLGLGATAAVLVHAGLQVYGAARAGLALRPRGGWRSDPDAGGAVKRLRRSVGVAAFPSMGVFAMLTVAGTLPGGVLVLQTSLAAYGTLSYLGPRAVSMAVMPLLSDTSGRADETGYVAAWRTGLFYAAMASCPILVLLVVFAGPTAELLTYGEANQAFLVAQLAACLAVVAVAQLAGGLHDIGRQALFARLDERGPLVASIAALATTLAVSAAALLFSEGTVRLVVLVAAILMAEVVAAAVVLVRMQSAIRPEPIVHLRQIGILLLGAVAIIPVALASRCLLAAVDSGRFATVAMLVAIGVLAVAVYAGAIKLVSACLSSREGR